MKIGTNQFLAIAVGFALSLGAIRGGAQQPDDSSSRSDDVTSAQGDGTSYMLSGTVVNSVTGEPIRRAAVQVSGQSGRIALTDHGGHFVLEGLAEGIVSVTAIKPGFLADDASNTPARVSKDAPSVVLKLTPWGVISGRVTTRDEQPLEGFHVRVFGQRNAEGRLVWTLNSSEGVTNDEGEFRIAGLKAGTYYVAIDQSVATMLSRKGFANAREQTFTKVFYPGVSEMSAATPIEIAAGQEADANFTLSGELLYRVSGTVGGDSSVATITFERQAGDGVDYTQMVAAQGGKFEVDVPAGTYHVSAETSEGKDLVAPGAAVIRADEADLQVALKPPVTIPVEIVMEQGAAGSERRVPAPQGVPGVLLQLDPVSRFPIGASVSRGQSGGIPDIAPGTYRLQITANADWWVKSARSGGVDLLSDDLTVTEGEQPDPIEVVVHEGTGAVSGTVPEGNPGHVLVLLVQPHGSRNIIRSAIALQGNFAISGVPPGDYSILALNDGDRLEYADPDVLNPYLSDAEQVSVRARGSATVNLGLTAVEK